MHLYHSEYKFQAVLSKVWSPDQLVQKYLGLNNHTDSKAPVETSKIELYMGGKSTGLDFNKISS
jgi:hypothetical protein